MGIFPVMGCRVGYSFRFPSWWNDHRSLFFYVGATWSYSYWGNNPISGGPVTGRRYGMLFTPDGTTDSIPGDGNPPDIRGLGSIGANGAITSLMTPQIGGLPSTTTIPLDCWNISKDATGGGIYVAANDGGVIKKLELQLDGTGANLVTSVFGRIGDVLAEPADYSTVNFSVNLRVDAGLLETGSNYNVALGNNAALSMTSGGYNANIGYGARAVITTGFTNTNIGTQAGSGITTGSGNTFIGYGAGWTAATGNSNIVIGNSDAAFAQVDVPAADTSNYLNIGNVIQGDMVAGPLDFSVPVLIQPQVTYLSAGLVPDSDLATDPALSGWSLVAGSDTWSAGQIVTQGPGAGWSQVVFPFDTIAGAWYQLAITLSESNSITSAWLQSNYFGADIYYIGAGIIGMDFQGTVTGADSISFYTEEFRATTRRVITNVSVRQIADLSDALVVKDNTENIFGSLGDPSRNLYLGYGAGGVARGGSNNVGIGVQTATGGGIGNVGIGSNSAAGTGNYNVCLGVSCGNWLSTGSDNLLIGDNAGSQTDSGSFNICIGLNAGASGAPPYTSIRGGQYNICIGARTGLNVTGASNYPNIGNVMGDMATPGSITMSADPVIPLGIATKQYVDNTVTTSLSDYLPLAGGMMTGDLTLFGPPTTDLMAATKLYVDQMMSAASLWQGVYDPTTNTPDLTQVALQNNGWSWTVNVAGDSTVALPGVPVGTAFVVGDLLQWIGSASTHAVIAGSPLNVTEADARYLRLAGGTMTGALVLSADHTLNLEAPTKQYVDAVAFTNPPDNKYYARQGGLTPGWVPTVDEAPLDGGQYVRESGGWVTSTVFVEPLDNKLYARQGGATPGWVHTVDEAPLDGGQYVRESGGWVTSSLTPAAPVNSIQFNNAGVFGGDANLAWDAVSPALNIGDGCYLNFSSGNANSFSIHHTTSYAGDWQLAIGVGNTGGISINNTGYNTLGPWNPEPSQQDLAGEHFVVSEHIAQSGVVLQHHSIAFARLDRMWPFSLRTNCARQFPSLKYRRTCN
jgi:hypothetical protein